MAVRGVDVEVLQLDATDQGGLANLLPEALFDGNQIEGVAVGILILAVDDFHQLHHHREAGEGFLAGGALHGFEDGAAEPMVEGTAACRVISTKTNDDR